MNPSVHLVSASGAARNGQAGPHCPGVFIVATRVTPTNHLLVEACRRLGVPAAIVSPPHAHHALHPGDIALGRIDVRATLDGVEPGLWVLRRLKGRGVRLVNSASTLVAAHDKLATAARLARSGIPHPRTKHLDDNTWPLPMEPPLVIKPRFGSGGRDVHRCDSLADLDACLHEIRRRPWFRRPGAVVQQLMPSTGRDLRLVVARGRVVGAIERVAPAGQWRTNVALGARRRPVRPPAAARAAAVAAAAALDGGLVGVDLLQGRGGYVVLEVNGAVDFTGEYALGRRDIFDEVVAAIVSETTTLPRSTVDEPTWPPRASTGGAGGGGLSRTAEGHRRVSRFDTGA